MNKKNLLKHLNSLMDDADIGNDMLGATLNISTREGLKTLHVIESHKFGVEIYEVLCNVVSPPKDGDSDQHMAACFLSDIVTPSRYSEEEADKVLREFEKHATARDTKAIKTMILKELLNSVTKKTSDKDREKVMADIFQEPKDGRSH